MKHSFFSVNNFGSPITEIRGKQGCQTPFTTVPDIDMIPSALMEQKLEVNMVVKLHSIMKHFLLVLLILVPLLLKTRLSLLLVPLGDGQYHSSTRTMTHLQYMAKK